MAKLILEANESFTLAPNTTNTSVFGTGDGQTKLTVGASSDVELIGFQRSVGDSVTVDGNAGDFEASRNGSRVSLSDGATSIQVDIGLNAADGTANTHFEFNDQSVRLGIDPESGNAEIAGQELPGDGSQVDVGGSSEPDKSRTDLALADANSPVDAGVDAFDFSFDASGSLSSTPFEISEFGGANNNDTLEILNADDVSFSSPGSDLEIDTTSGNTTNTVKLVGANPEGEIGFNEESVEGILGFDAFTIA